MQITNSFFVQFLCSYLSKQNVCILARLNITQKPQPTLVNRASHFLGQKKTKKNKKKWNTDFPSTEQIDIHFISKSNR